jgi:hypothetical protein
MFSTKGFVRVARPTFWRPLKKILKTHYCILTPYHPLADNECKLLKRGLKHLILNQELKSTPQDKGQLYNEASHDS